MFSSVILFYIKLSSSLSVLVSAQSFCPTFLPPWCLLSIKKKNYKNRFSPVGPSTDVIALKLHVIFSFISVWGCKTIQFHLLSLSRSHTVFITCPPCSKPPCVLWIMGTSGLWVSRSFYRFGWKQNKTNNGGEINSDGIPCVVSEIRLIRCYV